MKWANGAVVSILPFLVAGCAHPEFLQESTVPEQTLQVSSLVVEIDDTLLAKPAISRFGKSYVDAMGSGIKDSESTIPVSLVTTDVMQPQAKVVKVILAARPTHLLRLHTVSILSQSDEPVAVIWQLDLASVTVTPVAAADQPHRYRVDYKTVYRVQLTGPLCINDTALNAQYQVAQCGRQMGEAFAKELKEKHVITVL